MNRWRTFQEHMLMKRSRTHACSQYIRTHKCTRYESLRCSSMHAHMSTYVCANVHTCACIGEQHNDAYRVNGPGQSGLPRLGPAWSRSAHEPFLVRVSPLLKCGAMAIPESSARAAHSFTTLLLDRGIPKTSVYLCRSTLEQNGVPYNNKIGLE
jgi:hypothetical protein